MTDTNVAEAPAVETEAAAEPKAPRVKKVVEPTPCACQFYSGKDAEGNDLATGCDESTVRTFKPGHDAKLKSLLIKVGAAGGQVTKIQDGETSEMDPLHAAEEFGFRSLVEKSVDAAKAKQEARDARAKEREEKKAKADQAKQEARAARERKIAQKKAHADAVAKAAEEAKKTPGPAKVKIGRSTVEGEILNDGTFKYTKGDKEIEVGSDKFEVVIDPASVPVPEVG